MPIVSELRDVIGALQSEIEFEAAVRELWAAVIDRARISFLAQDEIAATCAGAVGYDIKQLPLKPGIRRADARRSRAS